jgi:hypothetical protein
MSSGLYTQPPQVPPSQFPTQPYPQPYAQPRASGSNWIFTLLLIGGGVLLLGSVLIVGAVWWAVSSLEGLVIDMGRESMVALVDESELPAAEKDEVTQQIDRVVAAYKAGEIDQSDLERLMMRLDESPAMGYIAWAGVDQFYLDELELPADEEARAKTAFLRALHAMSTGKIDEEKIYDAMPDDEAFDRALSDSPEAAREIYRKSIAKLQTLADEAGVPAEVPQVDVSGELAKLIDEMLAKK